MSNRLRSLQDSECPHGPTRLYYECHITIDPIPEGPERDAIERTAKVYGFRLAKLLMDKGVPSELDTFMTAHSKVYEDIHERARTLAKILQNSGTNVRRVKIEDTLLDTRHGDLL